MGYVQYVAVEQMDGRDSALFRLEEFGAFTWGLTREGERTSDSRRYAIYLDVGTTVALAQLQLLRDAMVHQYAVAIYFLDDTDDSGREDATGFRFAYEVMVIPVAIGDGVITAGTVEW